MVVRRNTAQSIVRRACGVAETQLFEHLGVAMFSLFIICNHRPERILLIPLLLPNSVVFLRCSGTNLAQVMMRLLPSTRSQVSKLRCRVRERLWLTSIASSATTLSALAGFSLDGLHSDWVYCPNNVESCFAHVRYMTEHRCLCLPPDDHISDRLFRHCRKSLLGKSWHGSVTASRAASALCPTAW